MPRRLTFEESLRTIDEQLLAAGLTGEKMLALSMEALTSPQESLVREIIGPYEDQMDELELQLEHECAVVLATQQPTASDLRMIMSALRIAGDLERVGDYCVDVAKASRKLETEAFPEVMADLRQMPAICLNMLQLSIEAFRGLDIESAERVGVMDKEIDRLYKRCKRMLMSTLERSPELTETGLELVLIARYFERIGDHITNVAERVIYAGEGKLRQLTRRPAPEDAQTHPDFIED